MGKEFIKNSELMPKYAEDSLVNLEDGTPDWVKTLIMVEVRIETATREGTLQSMIDILDHYQEMGVNGIWITPVNDRGRTGNGYGNLGPQTIDPYLTGAIPYGEPWHETDYEKGWKKFNQFIEEAHERNIRIFMDIISWGTERHGWLYEKHPDWYSGQDVWGGAEFNWVNDDFVEWYIQTVVDIGLKTNVDGFRFDLEPLYSSYTVCGEIRRRLYKAGRKMALISEATNERQGVYDFEQWGVLDNSFSTQHPRYRFLHHNIVDSIKSGEGIGSTHVQYARKGGIFRFYTNMLSSHDFVQYAVCGSRLAIGYQAIFAPVIPLWFMGEECNHPKTGLAMGALYGQKFDAADLDANREFYEDVKRMIRVRRQFPEIFNHYTKHQRDSLICKVDVDGENKLQAYARYCDGKAILIIPSYNENKPDGEFTVHVPLKEMGMNNRASYVITDLLTGEIIASGSESEAGKFEVKVRYDHIGIYLVNLG